MGESPHTPGTGRSSLILLMVLTAALWPGTVQAQDSSQTYIGAQPSPHITLDSDLDAGFGLLYELKFTPARVKFVDWEGRHPAEPLGPALAAAADLFEQFYRQGVLTSDFFLNDERLLGGITGPPDAELETRFLATAQRSEEKARARLGDHPRDPDALFALTLISGMRADNAVVIERKQFESIHFLREGDRAARELLAIAPSTEDAYLALGAANYIVGSLSSFKRAFLWMGGVHGDKTLGIQQLTRAASSGHYLRPYAKLLLALTALREKNPALARVEFAELAAEFPANALFARELAKITPALSPGPSWPTR